ncbi:MAG: class I SAM-dependent rRNA methyltransferase [Ignavibacteriales bacterium]|nr:class I SAM-dependent rRNA methyltransferase [Ignavibacteriales bacterium]
MKKQIVLKKNEEHRILAGHQWVFSNEIKTVHGSPESGDVIELLRHDEKFLGIGFYNPHSLIAFRLLSREQEEVSFEFFEKRISRALQLRKRMYSDSETFRVVHGEGDFLPGLVIDKYNEYISLQTLSVGMDRRLTLICDVLESIFHPKAIVERNESSLRSLEQLPIEKGVLRGTIGQTIITENAIKYKVDLLEGQKTGFFLDQRENRKSIRQYVKDATVLDCFCNEGGFSLNAALAHAKSVHAIDISQSAIANAKVNTTINDVTNARFETADVFERLKELETTGEKFDVVILDPPSFSRNKKTVATALKGYKEINTRALHLLHAGGILVSASCSHHITEESFIETIEAGARASHRSIQLLEFSGASPDHPSLPTMPETKYLKFTIFAVQ